MNTKKPDTGRQPLKETTLLTEEDIFLFNEGTHFQLYSKLGSHLIKKDGVDGTCFAVWAPNAEKVFVMGDFNNWDRSCHPLKPRGVSGIWEGFIPATEKGDNYKYFIHSRYNGYKVEKGDPFAFYYEVPPKTASIIWDLEYEWGDHEWMAHREEHNKIDAPMAIYEIHLGSWRRRPEEGNRSLTYRELALELPDYVLDTGFTHVEFLPIMEHPFYGSWGYQTLGYFAPTSRLGEPQDLMYLIDSLHRKGIGVILDWVPSHFPSDEYGLAYFDGTHLFEHADQRKGLHPEWDSCIFNYGRKEIQSFLISSAHLWLNKYHADGIRVDAVASMLYLDYGRKNGEWIPNDYGGNENIEAINFIRRLNEELYKDFPGTQTIAEESTSWPMVSRPTYVGGLGFGLKWDMGWMHDTLQYMAKEPVHRKFHHDRLTFRLLYAFNENFVLPLSHDEVVYGKGSLLRKMPGDEWQRFANLRLLLSYMYAQPGKKLLFMGGEFGQENEWYHESSLDWHILDRQFHRGVKNLVGDLNRLYAKEQAMHDSDSNGSGFEWIDCNDAQQSTISLIRKASRKSDTILAVFNFTPVPRHGYRVGTPKGGNWSEVLNTDAKDYGGSGQGNFGGRKAESVPFHGRSHSILITLPPLAAVYFKWEAA